MTSARQGWPALLVSTAARFVLGVLVLLVAVSVLPAVFGWQSTVVMSGSMAPALRPGDVVVVRPAGGAQLHAGQIVLVDDPDVPGELRIHRIAARNGDRLRLKGDANPSADGSEVSTAAVHGVGTLRLPGLGLPVLWSAQGRTAPLAATAVALAALIALALLHRGPEGVSAPEEPGSVPRRAGWGLRWFGGVRRDRRLRRVLALGAAGIALAGLPGATGSRAVFSGVTSTPSNSLAAAAYWSCGAAATGAGATQYYPLQETSGTTAANAGTLGSGANALYSSKGITYGVPGPECDSTVRSAVTLDGSQSTKSVIWTDNAVTDPETFSEQIWFATTTTSGGKLIGFGDGTNGGSSGNYDRHLYLTDSGRLSFGVYNGQASTVTSAAAYNDGAWHLATATFSGSTGMTLYVDGAQVARNSAVTAAQNYTGYWRIGYDSLSGWPNQPSSDRFAGSLAHAAVFPTALTATQVSQQYKAAPLTCAEAAGPSGANAALYLPLQEGSGPTAGNAGTSGAAGNGTYSPGGVTYGAGGPGCGTNANGGVRLDGSSGYLWTTQAVTAPQTFTEQIWFSTTTTSGGKLIGFGSGANGAQSSQFDRHIYMANSGTLTFGVYNGGYFTIASPTAYNDGAWHLATATFSPTTGMAFYVDGALVGTNTQTTAAENSTGYWRAGYDNLGSWPAAPTSAYFAGRVAQASVSYRVLPADEVTGQYLAGK